MHLKLTVHVQARLYERSIDIDHVKQAISNPDEKKASSVTKVLKKIGDRTIIVVYSEEMTKDKHRQYLIITAYYL